VGLYERVTRRWRKQPVLDAAMAQRQAGESDAAGVPASRASSATAPILVVERLAKSFGGIHAVREASFKVRDRTLHALIGPNGAGKTTAFNLISGMFRPTRARAARGAQRRGTFPERITAAGVGARSRSPTSSRRSRVQENVRLAVQARDRKRFWFWIDAAALADVNAKTVECCARWGSRDRGRAGGRALLRRAAAARHVARARHAPAHPAARRAARGLAAGERERVGTLIKGISRELPVLLVEHDIDRVFALADAVTVMNDGEVLVDGTWPTRAIRRACRRSTSAPAPTRSRGAISRARARHRAPRDLRASTPSTARATSCATWASTCATARSWRSSDATAPASRRC
jgi:ABC-type branched-subunit amino acid transport system ATPase component